MKVLFLLLFSFLFILGAHAQPPAANGTGIEEIYLAKDDGNGKAGEVVTSFGVSDIPIHCIVQLDSIRVANVKMIFVAVNVAGVKPETRVVTTSYTTGENQNQVNFTGRPDKAWTPGKYRVDIFLEGKLARSQEFLIEKSGAAKATDDPAINSFQPKRPVKPKTPGKTVRN